MMWKFLGHHLIDPDHVIGVLVEPGMGDDGHESYALNVLLDTGEKIEATTIDYEPDAPDLDPIMREASALKRNLILKATVMAVAGHFGHAADIESANEVMVAFDSLNGDDTTDFPGFFG